MQLAIETVHAYIWLSLGVGIGVMIMALIQMNGPDDPTAF